MLSIIIGGNPRLADEEVFCLFDGDERNLSGLTLLRPDPLPSIMLQIKLSTTLKKIVD